MSDPPIKTRYDVVIAGARCAGASTAMLLARWGLDVLCVDPVPMGRDTLSTHALMRAGVLQLHRWGLLDQIRGAGTPPITSTTFHYGDEPVTIPIKPKDGVDALFAPRRTVLDPVLVKGAVDAGADVRHGYSVTDLVRDASGRVRGAVITGKDTSPFEVRADVVIGADGLRSRIARLVDAPIEHAASHATAAIYGYFPDMANRSFQWHYATDASVGTITTNNGDNCVFVSLPPTRFNEGRSEGLGPLFHRTLETRFPELATTLPADAKAVKLRAFPGVPGFLRRSAGPGWALVGDAGYFKDPLTAHGITDALRDAELLARAVAEGGEGALGDYQQSRNELVKDFMGVTDQIASFNWDLEQAKALHLQLSREMNKGVAHLLALDSTPFAAASPTA